ncbi:hypothetical protein NPX13_g3069 [Xylaria arbuscula]|uniref:Uncharacterized protein n=1 Tax=Xylaria arbuscula TaxID=114810 RepID=A0A9W8NI03_9PEZI|nr:hypothetical protein NPX13_g3069 [Xylaria arbuscula]
MHGHGSRPPRRKQSRGGLGITDMDFSGHYQNVDQVLVNESDAHFLEGNLDDTIDRALFLSDDQIFGDNSLLPPTSNPLWMSTRFSDYTPWSIAHQSSVSAGVPSSAETLRGGALYVRNGQTEELPYHQFPITLGSDASYTTENRVESSLGYSNNTGPASVGSSLPILNDEIEYGNGQTSNVVYQYHQSLENEHAAHPYDSLDGEQSSHNSRTLAPLASGSSHPTLAIALSPSYKCLLCPGTPRFGTLQEYKRHQNYAKNHRTEESRYYRCACGKAEIAGRRDNHYRHLDICYSPARQPYACRCGEKSSVKLEHVAHIKRCVHRRRQCP